MKKQVFRPEQDGFNGAWYPAAAPSDSGLILMLGDSAEDRMAATGARWLNELGFHVMAMSPDKKDYGHHSYPLERFGKAMAWMKAQGCEKLGVAGASTTGMMALLAAAHYPELTLTIAISPPDFVMEAFYRDGKDGMRERPGDNESSVTWQGEPLPYLPYAYRHPEYWLKIQEESKAGGDKVASRKLFDESERRHPLREEEKIRVENIHGEILFIGAEDDVLWDTCRYIHRMEERLAALPHASTYESWLYRHGTHFVFPETMLRQMLPVGSSLLVRLMFRAGKEYPRECRETRMDIDKRLRQALQAWKSGGAAKD